MTVSTVRENVLRKALCLSEEGAKVTYAFIAGVEAASGSEDAAAKRREDGRGAARSGRSEK
jgi:hypothetical protein